MRSTPLSSTSAGRGQEEQVAARILDHWHDRGVPGLLTAAEDTIEDEHPRCIRSSLTGLALWWLDNPDVPRATVAAATLRMTTGMLSTVR